MSRVNPFIMLNFFLFITLYALQEFLDKYGIIHSMSEPGTPVDNAVVESYHRSIKRELIYHNKHKNKS